MKVYGSVSELVGKTPLLKLNNLMAKYGLKANLYAKLEYFNPAGSAKDRVALNMILDAENKGLLTKGGTIIEPTSGNTGIGLAAIGASKGYKTVLVMPSSMSVERQQLLKAFGAQVVLTDSTLGMQGAIEKAEEIQKNTPNSLVMGQFENPANSDAHYKTTGKEIFEDLDGKVDIFVAGIGTGGTISGTAKYLKEQNKNIKVVGFEPFDSPLITKGVIGAHKLQGIGANFIPKNYDEKLVDEVLTVKTLDAYEGARELATLEGVLVGITSGASLSVGKLLAEKEENKGKNIVVLLPDLGDRYLSTDLFTK
ncbi:MAG: cysteine synthase A [Clostridiales bacterium]|nr:cysteine synthase A [Clostridiales bacterium]